MKIKQFLKLDWRKIVIFFFPFLLGNGLFIFCNSAHFVVGSPILIFCDLLVFGLSSYGKEIVILWEIYWIIISYLISCFIIWIYYKVKKK